MADHSGMKLGKAPPRHDPRTLRLAAYTAALPAPPSWIDWSLRLTNLGAMGNDRLGDCTCAAIGHIIQTWTAASTSQVVLPDATIIQLYRDACGYDPGDSSTDRGGVEIDVLNYWRKHSLDGHQLDAYCSIRPGDTTDIKNGITLFGAVYVGVALPVTAQRQDIWDVGDDLTGPNAPGSWGGHAIPCVAYDAHGLTCITWGLLKRMTWGFWAAYCDEAYALLGPDWLGVDDMAPSGFDMAALAADLAGL